MEVWQIIADHIVWPILGFLGWTAVKTIDTDKKVTALEAKFEASNDARDKELQQLFNRFDRFEERMFLKLDDLEAHVRAKKDA